MAKVQRNSPARRDMLQQRARAQYGRGPTGWWRRWGPALSKQDRVKGYRNPNVIKAMR